MNYSKSLITVFTSGFLSLISVTQVSAQTLEEAVHLMLSTEPELRAVDLDSRSSFQDWKIARGDLFPQITVGGSSGVRERDRSTDGLVTQSGDALYSNEIGVSIRQLLFDGGVVRNEAKAASAFYDAQRFLQMSQIESRVVDLAEVYHEVIRVQQQLVAARENVGVHRDMREKFAERQRNGGVRADTSLIDGRLSLAQNSLYTQELALEQANLRFKRLTGAEPGYLKTPSVPATSGRAEDLDIAQNWDYLAASAALEAADLKRKSKKGLYSPNVYLDAGASRGEDTLGVRGQDDEVRALLVLSWDLYRGGANKASNQRERLQYAKAGELLRAADVQRDYQLHLLIAEKEGSKASTGSLEQYVNKLGRVIGDYEEQFRIGQKELLSILDVRNEHYQGLSRLIDSRFNEYTTTYRIMGTQGRLVQHLIGDSIQDYVTVGDHKADKWYPHSQQPAAMLDSGKSPVRENGIAISGQTTDGSIPVANVETASISEFSEDATTAPTGESQQQRRKRLRDFFGGKD